MPPIRQTLLTYRLGSSSALAVGTQVNLTLKVLVPSDQSIGEIAVTLPVGGGEDDLTEEPDVITPSIIMDPTRTVDFSKSSVRGKFVASAGDAPIRLRKGMELRLVLENIRVNAKTGHPEITIAETAGTTTRQHKIPLSKFAAGFVFKDFRPSKYLIDLARDKKVDLSWYIAKGDQRPEVRLRWSGGARQGRNVSTTKVTPVTIHRDTAFELTATVPGTGGGRALTHTLNTFVTVAEPRLSATKLSVHHAARIFSRRHTEVRGFGLGPSRAAPFGANSSLTLVPETVFQAAADGLLTARVHNLTPGTATTLHIRLQPPDGTTTLHTLELTGTGAEDLAHVVVPVPHHHRVALMATGRRLDTDKTTIGYRLHAEWNPIGTGALESPAANTHRTDRT
ncbi:hypothetical protein AB0H73_10920 [Streptomyces olivoreticuli]